MICVHYVADFILQDGSWATNKWTSIKDLTLHVMVYTFAWVIPSYMFLGLNSCWFLIITFICHWITDFFTSKVNHKLAESKNFGGKIPNLGLFSMIFFDQLLHIGQIFLTYHLLS